MNYVSKDACVGGPNDRYRYWLERRWRWESGYCLFCMLNPSTADAAVDDATIRKCVGFADRWGYPAISVVNLYAFRTRHPKMLKASGFNIGPQNDEQIRAAALNATLIVAAWGTWAQKDRAAEVTKILSEYRPVWCLGLTQEGYPKHPLLVPYAQDRVLFAKESVKA